ncbi:hypothetical protein CTI12_AA312950 [Artemisia annua]|uniref:OTU domain-containing protein n=1 Tax=Artemisia annua TaxID=35608 RepID=A0A2U1MQY4_ARTAN|nr:hypothetical protein CTI12_AA312950 [Artemisia annua]
MKIQTRNKRTKRSRKTTLNVFRGKLEANNTWLRKHLDTLTFYRKRLSFKEPSSVLLDGSMFYYLALHGKTLDHICELIKDFTANFYTTDCVVREMEFYFQSYSGPKDVLEESIKRARTVELVSCVHGKEISAEKCITNVVGIYNSKKVFVATTVNGCWPLVNENPLIPIITVNDGSLVLKNLSGNQRQKAKGWSSATPVEKSALTDKELRESPDYERLLRRFDFYGYVGEIALGDGNNQVKAISQQLGPSDWPHEKVRAFVVKQILLHSELYENLVNPPSVDSSNWTFLEYLFCTSKDGAWGETVTLQAAADAFEVKIVVIDSSEDCAVHDFFPYGVEHPKKVLCLSCVTCQDETHYNSIQKLPDRSIASTCSRNYLDPKPEEQDHESE